MFKTIRTLRRAVQVTTPFTTDRCLCITMTHLCC